MSRFMHTAFSNELSAWYYGFCFMKLIRNEEVDEVSRELCRLQHRLSHDAFCRARESRRMMLSCINASDRLLLDAPGSLATGPDLAQPFQMPNTDVSPLHDLPAAPMIQIPVRHQPEPVSLHEEPVLAQLLSMGPNSLAPDSIVPDVFKTDFHEFDVDMLFPDVNESSF
eukprot:TRINITY_DN2246_c0_g1_i2.p1 TRINITY_DN2246_c0_g1~~TRINITY_DN2246_c0_g1_i2.p1  ORF type:complete len:169 (+),score=30.17 TRINITY_DN2246_c0_g1_i2:422-928(+)